MYAHLGLSLSYLLWTLLFVLSGSLVFNSLVSRALRGPRFYALFGGAFMAYAAGWCGSYFMLRTQAGEWLGSLSGSILMAIIFAWGFNKLAETLRFALLLFVANSCGYFLGSALHQTIGGQSGMILWGISYGLCLGAGIGAVMHFSQR